VNIGEIKEQLATRKGFAARVERRMGLRNLGMGVGFVGLVFGTLLLLVGRAADSLRLLTSCLSIGLAVVLAGLVHERLRLPLEHRRYLAHGWVSVQVDTGLIRDDSGDGSTVERDLSPGSERRSGRTPIVLVGGREASPEEVEAAGAAARDDVLRMTDEQARLFALRVNFEGLYRDVDAATLFPVPPGMFLTVRTGSSPFVVVIPPAGLRRRTPRYYGIKVPPPPVAPGRLRESSSWTSGRAPADT